MSEMSNQSSAITEEDSQSTQSTGDLKKIALLAGVFFSIKIINFLYSPAAMDTQEKNDIYRDGIPIEAPVNIEVNTEEQTNADNDTIPSLNAHYFDFAPHVENKREYSFFVNNEMDLVEESMIIQSKRQSAIECPLTLS